MQIWRSQLGATTGDDWKDVRSTFTPIFTSGKMKGMMKFLEHVSSNLVEEMKAKAQSGDEFELKEIFGKFSLDSLASSAFGVDAESFTNKKSLYNHNAKHKQ